MRGTRALIFQLTGTGIHSHLQIRTESPLLPTTLGIRIVWLVVMELSCRQNLEVGLYWR